MGTLNEFQAQAVVDGILEGYKNYLDERRQKKEELRVSAGYAFTKGNHIDDTIAKKLQGLIEEDTLAKAGESWEYLQFTFSENGDTCLFIVKNVHRLNRTFQSSHKQSRYLVDLATINNSWIEELRTKQVKMDGITIQLQFFDFEEKENLEKLISRGTISKFYIVTYETDQVTKKVTKIELVAPDAQTRELHLIQNLTPYLATSRIVIEDDEYSVISNEGEFVGTDDYGYTAPAEEETGN
ncbi:hypothetical protein HB820_01635 [Listeria booriae]|uniref:spr1630 family ClpXP-sensitive toxin n=1 Tax=Listeria booriae TaxID=1552123 RepID=UPI0016254427|nr:hypothetical protein [Listeria booriae]MBC1291102.1 hypothetical protein [Listeria booriae]MBC1333978.1 hypothetical protein [Listeria booriae]MBC1944050.1 hypothetical protein [Listeria booriae]MBC6165097.1 hypothetical protein [Listeria booriae]